MLTTLFVRLGISRDSVLWFWLQIGSVAGLISSNAFNVPYWMAYLGIPLSPTALHWIFATSALVLWLSGKYNASPLPSAPAMASGAVPGSPAAKIGLVLLACVLVGSLTACGSHLTPKVTIDVSDRTAYAALRVVDVDEELAYHQKGVWPTPQQHIDFSKKLSAGYQAIIDVANIGVNLPAGAALSADNLAKVSTLSGFVTDLVSLASPAAGAKLQDDVQTFVSKATALITAVKGLVSSVSGSTLAQLRTFFHHEINAAATARLSTKGR